MPTSALAVFLRRCFASPPPLLVSWLHRLRASHNGLITPTVGGEMSQPLTHPRRRGSAYRSVACNPPLATDPERRAQLLALDLADGRFRQGIVTQQTLPGRLQLPR